MQPPSLVVYYYEGMPTPFVNCVKRRLFQPLARCYVIMKHYQQKDIYHACG